MTLHYGDLTDSTNMIRLIQDTQPDEIYNLGAQSHVKVSFETPEYTANVDGIGALRCLEAIRLLGLEKKTKYYQASTSELFGESSELPQNEATPFCPRSPYAAAKLYAHWITVNYREAYGIFACNGILFNHESPRRGETFVTRKITRAIGRIAFGLQKKVYLGNLDSLRDWGYAPDYVEAMWLMLQQHQPDDYVIATGVSKSVRSFCETAFSIAGITIAWEGQGILEKGVVSKLTEERQIDSGLKTGDIVVEVDPVYYRPTEVNVLQGDYQKAKTTLGWSPKVRFHELVGIMINHDLSLAQYEKHKLAFQPNSRSSIRSG